MIKIMYMYVLTGKFLYIPMSYLYIVQLLLMNIFKRCIRVIVYLIMC